MRSVAKSGVLLCLTWFTVEAQSLPQIGEMLDVGGSMRPVFGVAGSFMVGPARADKVLSAACSAEFCLAKTGSAILSPSGKVAAPLGPALMAIQGDSAYIYFPSTRTVARWQADRLEPANWSVRETPLSIRAGDSGIEVAVRSVNGVWIVRSNGSFVARVPGATGPVMLLADGILLVIRQELILRRADGREFRFDLPDVQALSALGANYVEIRTRNAVYALRTEPGREQLFLLPGSPK